MKYYEHLANKRVFDFNYMIELTGNKDLASQTIQNYLNKGLIKRVKRNLYAVMSLETNGLIPTKFEIACKITKSSYIYNYSAFEFHGYSNQVSNQVLVATVAQFHDFVFENTTFVCKRVNDTSFVETINSVKVSSLAKTIVDTIDTIKTYDDLEELINILDMIPVINGKDILTYLMRVNRTILYSKVGLVLSFYEDGYNITKEMLKEMKENGLKIARNFTSEKHRLNTYYEEWKLHVYDIDKLKKGES